MYRTTGDGTRMKPTLTKKQGLCMKSKIWPTLSVLLAVCCICAAENLINNPDFSKLSPAGLPMHWVFGGNSGSRQKSENGIVVISPRLAAVQREIGRAHV